MNQSSPSQFTPSQFIGGKLQDSSAGRPADVLDPSTGQVVARVTLATPDDVDRAVEAATAAWPAWSRTTPAERSAILARFARLLEERAEEIARLESRQAGKPIRLAREFDVPGTIDNVDFFSGAARNLEGRATAEYSAGHTSSIRREPVGVVGPSRRGTTRCRWPRGRSCRRSPLATRSCSSPPRSPR
jgi:betaine-aldehyde dehydrogenase